MQVHAGSRIGPYEVVASVGAGGMGEVYRARDVRLDRDVAIKILPAAFAEDAQLRLRFEREAKAISSLNHPHICTLHDVGQHEGVHYLVMELIEGEPLAERLVRGPLPIEQVLRYGAQIAAALDAAHRRGVIHRDLKPGNIMITKSGAKLLDFGLAKASDSSVFTRHSSMTELKPITEQGTILGTFQYMSPEQLEGIEVDARSDIFALGAVLYEMATARRAFDGKSKTSLIAAIVSAQPAPITSVAPMTPPALDHVIRKCLEKDPDERWQSAHDVASELRWIEEAGSQAGAPAVTSASRRSRKKVLAAAAITGWMAAAGAVAWLVWQRAETESLRRPFRAQAVLTAPAQIAGLVQGAVALSPDGFRLAYSLRERQSGIAVHDFTTGRSQILEGSSDGTFPFWSPDGRWIGFFADGKLKKVAATGGAAQIICDARDGRGGSWSRNGTILFAPDVAGPLMKVSGSGGTPEVATRTPSGIWSHRNPFFLPDGERFLLTERENRRQPVGSIAVGSLDRLDVTTIAIGSNPQFADGYLFTVRDRNLIAQRFDGSAGKLSGTPIPLGQRIEYVNPRDIGNFSVASSGVLVYRERAAVPAQLAWFNRAGQQVATVGEPGLWALGRRTGTSSIVTLIRRDDTNQESVWVMNLARGQATRATENYTTITRAIPSATAPQIVVSTWAASPTTTPGVWLQGPSGIGTPKKLMESSEFIVEDWSHDGKILVGGLQKAGSGFDIFWSRVDDPTNLHAFAASRFNEQFARLSPNGRWLAYTSDEGGLAETYISDFPEGKNRWQVTQSGGLPVGWRPDGAELFVTLRGRITAYPVAEADEMLEIGRGVTLPPAADVIAFVGADRDNLLMLKTLAGQTDESLQIVRNWRALVE